MNIDFKKFKDSKFKIFDNEMSEKQKTKRSVFRSLCLCTIS